MTKNIKKFLKSKKIIAIVFAISISIMGCGKASDSTLETETFVETIVEDESEEIIESSIIEEDEETSELVEENSTFESEESLIEESSIEEETSTKASNETSKETTNEISSSSVVVEATTDISNPTTVNNETSEVASNTTINETPIVETPIESVVETPQEITSSTTTSSLYSVDEYISIVKSELIKNGIQWYPDSDEYKECRALYPDIYIGPDGGMGWAIIDVDMSNPYYVSEELLDGFKFDRLDYFYIEVLSSSNNNIQFKLYRG
jgi:hypothetical protein